MQKLSHLSANRGRERYYSVPFRRDGGNSGFLSLFPSRSTLYFIANCLAWYLSSALSSNTSKALLSAPKHVMTSHPNDVLESGRHGQALHPPDSSSAPFPYPISLTFVQFLFVHGFCYICTSERLLGKRTMGKVMPPAKERILEVGQLSLFTVIGHALSSLAISRVPVSTVHTIKALSPLFTVIAYSLFFSVTYSSATWLSLLPLTIGVMMACTGLSLSAEDILGLFTALGSTMIFVAQNIYSKKLLSGNGHGSKDLDKMGAEGSKLGNGVSTGKKRKDQKLDKLNILLYSSGCASTLMIPMVLYYDASSILTSSTGASFGRVLSLLLANGIVNFAQNVLAFSILALVSPVTYSIASLLKRVFVICFAIVWFRQQVTMLQWLGITLASTGVWMYNNAKVKNDVAQVEEKVHPKGNIDSFTLPTTASATTNKNGHANSGYVTTSGLGGRMAMYGSSLSPTAARFQHAQGQPHMSVSKISGSFGSSTGNGVTGPGSWRLDVGGGLHSPTQEVNRSAIMNGAIGPGWRAKSK
ncbi:TPT-domain-containing protein [Tilletiaria anomala UBC 951]|uniref:TPT-domain-containing protein n=1 Tax=Tilletiaria anomala (strain ATCC 24038 / CBS 436.72 / UBC 951) TaxID=1037660 RepID=A0A066WHF0_TILAU|nr:TPT-domain-containing protein [Tilletiaria anomala UBC 951]KDN53246.1 TPT-domain-containing protein [Tilletiaria anomala UBC 951]